MTLRYNIWPTSPVDVGSKYDDIEVSVNGPVAR